MRHSRWAWILPISLALMATGCHQSGQPAPDRETKPDHAQAVAPSAPAELTPAQVDAVKADQEPHDSSPIIAEAKFQPGGIPDGWEWIDPKDDANRDLGVRPGYLRISASTGNDLFPDSNYDAPRLLHAVAGDFELETRLKCDPRQVYQGAGLLVGADTDAFLRLERGFGGVGGAGSRIGFSNCKGGVFSSVATVRQADDTASEIELMIRRRGSQFTAFWREPGQDWKSIGTTKLDLPDQIKAGVIVCVEHRAPPFNADFALIRITASNDSLRDTLPTPESLETHSPVGTAEER